jgi:hypothetical protein
VHEWGLPSVAQLIDRCFGTVDYSCLERGGNSVVLILVLFVVAFPSVFAIAFVLILNTFISL